MTAALTLTVGAVAQQAGSLRGTVYDREFNAPIGEAQVSVVETGQRTSTDAQGVFVFAQLTPGTYTLVVAKDGYVRQVRADLLVTAGQLTDLSIQLAGDFTDLEPFVVSDVLRIGAEGDAALLELRLESPALVNTISSDLMSRAGASDAASALRLVSGASLQDGKTAVIRGLPDRYVSSQMNGVRLPSADEDKRAVELDQFPSEVISSIQVSKTFTPDQQGDASGGAVDVRLRGVPEEPFLFKWKLQTSHNTQVTGRSRFLSYRGGGLHYFGDAASSRAPQESGQSWDGAVGVTEQDAPLDYKWSTSLGGKVEIAKGVRVGGTVNLFYERDSSFEDKGIDDSYVGSTVVGAPLVPETSSPPSSGGFSTSLLDITQGKQSVQWGGLGTLGLETDEHALTFVYLFTRSADDIATKADDTRGKQYFFPDYDPDEPSTPGQDDAPYLRLQTLEYTERETATMQLHGLHRLAPLSLAKKAPAELDWTIARSSADRDQPDKRLFATQWARGAYSPFKPAEAALLGNVQRTYKKLSEDSDQLTVGFKLPFEQWSGLEGYLKVGYFGDHVERTYQQDSFSNFLDNGISFPGQFDELDWSASWPFENHPIRTDGLDNGIDEGTDVDYVGRQSVRAQYAMVDLPLSKSLNLIGGVRWESTALGVVLAPEANATWLPEGESQESGLAPGDGDVDFHTRDVLPSAALVYRPLEAVTLRAAYNETIARQTFKELTPILNQEYLGGPVFVGNPNLEISQIRNYDLRADVTPIEGTLLSASWFRKDIENPIEYIERSTTFSFTFPVNYPRGRLSGLEFEARQELGKLWEPISGLSTGGNLTLIDARVNLPDSEILAFEALYGERPRSTRDMTSAPSYLYNLFLTYDVEATGSQFGIFYTVQGETLLSGASVSPYIPATYQTRFGTLNLSLTQKLGDGLRLSFAAKNLTDAEHREVYRSDYVTGDVLRRRGTDGIEYSLTLGGEYHF
jgi:outer membrane receptor protein involved in Fe transport